MNQCGIALLWALLVGLCAGCGGGASVSASATLAAQTTPTSGFAKGADVSWLTQEEASGVVFRSASSVQKDALSLLQQLGTNAVRLRVWVNPDGGWNNSADTLAKATRAQALGLRIMVDFHYSDTWADPGHQTKPAAWSNDDFTQLKSDVYTHTFNVLTALNTAGISVSWVQVGNEINGGMLWPDGSYQKFAQLAALINSGYSATKAVYPNAKVIVHLANGTDNAAFRWFFDTLQSNGGQWDVIGMSYYPARGSWLASNEQIGANLADMVTRYQKPVMVVEVGMDWQQAATAQQMIADLINRVALQGTQGLGVFYWEPEAYPGWQGYTMGAVNDEGQFTQALAAFTAASSANSITSHNRGGVPLEKP